MNIDHYINEGQDPRVVEKLLLKLQDMLASTGEDIVYIAVQKKPAVSLFPDSIALTDKRVFLCKSSKLGFASDFEIHPWDHIQDIVFKEGVLGSRVTFMLTDGESTEMGYIPKNQARKLYQSGMEAVTQAAKGVAAIEDPILTMHPMNEPEDELTLRLEKLKSLFQRELITQTEYESKKNELLSQL